MTISGLLGFATLSRSSTRLPTIRLLNQPRITDQNEYTVGQAESRFFYLDNAAFSPFPEHWPHQESNRFTGDQRSRESEYGYAVHTVCSALFSDRLPMRKAASKLVPSINRDRTSEQRIYWSPHCFHSDTMQPEFHRLRRHFQQSCPCALIFSHFGVAMRSQEFASHLRITVT